MFEASETVFHATNDVPRRAYRRTSRHPARTESDHRIERLQALIPMASSSVPSEGPAWRCLVRARQHATSKRACRATHDHACARAVHHGRTRRTASTIKILTRRVLSRPTSASELSHDCGDDGGSHDSVRGASATVWFAAFLRDTPPRSACSCNQRVHGSSPRALLYFMAPSLSPARKYSSGLCLVARRRSRAYSHTHTASQPHSQSVHHSNTVRPPVEAATRPSAHCTHLT